MNKPIVFYGAGRDAERLIDEFNRYNPACFVDKDQNKQSTLFMGRKVMSLEQSLHKYPNALFYVTSSLYKGEIIFELLQHIDSSRIINYLRYSKRFGCKFFENLCSFGTFGGDGRLCLSFCCGAIPGHNEYPITYIPDYLEVNNYEELSTFIKNSRNDFIKNFGGKDHVCEGCSQLEYDYFPDKKTLNAFNYNMADACNCDCFFCNNNISKTSKTNHAKTINHNFVELAENLKRYGVIDDDTTFTYASGEFLLAKDKDKILEWAKSNVITIYSNGILYDEKLNEWMNESSVSGQLNISLDCGTRETFYRIKRRDSFEHVCENIVKYGKNREKNFLLKYVFCENYNDNDLDVDGFVNIAKEGNASLISISHNFNEFQKPISESVIRASQRLYHNASRKQIPIVFRTPNYTSEQIARIKLSYEQYNPKSL